MIKFILQGIERTLFNWIVPLCGYDAINDRVREVRVGVNGGLLDSVGAANVATSQVATSTSAATLVAARTTRRKVLARNLDGTITVYIGPATVTAANGYALKANESVALETTALLQVIAASGTPTVAVTEIYD